MSLMSAAKHTVNVIKKTSCLFWGRRRKAASQPLPGIQFGHSTSEEATPFSSVINGIFWRDLHLQYSTVVDDDERLE